MFVVDLFNVEVYNDNILDFIIVFLIVGFFVGLLVIVFCVFILMCLLR